jgi:UDP:flavonoid glycosyltransferase YjiC (YdhE family)
MSTFLVASIPVPAHTANPMPFVARLVERGHRVLWYSGRHFHPAIEAIGAVPVAYTRAMDFGGRQIGEVFPEFADLPTIQAVRRAFADVFVGHAADRVADLREILAAEPVDAMLCDGLMFGVGMVGELDGVPWATFGDGPLPYEDADTPPFGPALQPMRGPVGRIRNRVVRAVGRRMIFGEAQQVYERTRRELGLPITGEFALDASMSPFLHLQGCTPGFEYPRRSLPPQVHWVGALRPDPPKDWTPPAWWGEVTDGGRPVVVVSQGTIRPDLTELIEPSVRALGGADVLVVVTTGGADPQGLGELPANVRATSFIPYDVLFRHADVFVTNGGYTGVTLALAHGVPLVQAGDTEEKTEIGARIHWSGSGVRVGTGRPTDTQVRDAVTRVLTHTRYRDRARALRDEMAGHDAGSEGASLLEELATRRAGVVGSSK